jgi:membrane fusion protein, heavy metal efflux system
VKKGRTLFTIDSPDLLAAESSLIAAAGVLDLTTRNLARLQELYKTRAVSQAQLEQAISDQQTAEGNLRAGRDAVRIFGKSDAEIDTIVANRLADPTLVVASPIDGRITQRNASPGLFVQPGNPPAHFVVANVDTIVANRLADPTLVVASPIDGRITQRNASPGLFVQPGNPPAPFVVANVDTMWMLANVTETDSPAFRVGQPLQVKISAFPGRVFEGKVTTVGAIVDPNTRRVLVRSEIKDPQHELRSGMFANFVIGIGAPVQSPAVPINGVVREGDGTQTVWVTSDRRQFIQRTVKIGIQRDGYRQILNGLQAGELVATDGAIFLSNMLALASGQ